MSHSPELVRLVREHWRSMGAESLGHEDDAMLEMLSEERALEAMELVAASVPFSLEGRRVLEVGCGIGTSLLAGRGSGCRTFGIEPGPGAHAGRLLFLEQEVESAPIARAVAESLPFPDCSFDVVCSFQVLEHTRSPRSALAESVRVLRPGGYLVHVFPNYGSLWEGHYGIPWVPHLPRSLGRLYLRLLRRDPAMLEDLQLLTRGRVERMLAGHPEVQIVSWGFDLWERRMKTLNFSEWAHLGRLKRIVRLLHRLRLVGLVVALGRTLHLETPIVLVATRRQ